MVFDEASLPYPVLSDYNFFEGEMKDQEPVYGVIPYSVITPLFSDYAHKYRFVWMKEGAQGRYAGDGEVYDFDDGVVFIKTFFYDRALPADEKRLMETRLEMKIDGEWTFAEYIWNDEQTEAVLNMNGAQRQTDFIDDNGLERSVNYRFPSATECLTCHKENELPLPIGPKPQNIKKTFDYPEGSMDQIDKLIDFGYLADDTPASIDIVADWTDESRTMTDRVRAYLDMNCSHCHRQGSHCDYRPMRLAWTETDEEINLGVCVVPEEPINSTVTHIINRGIPDRSMMYYRMASTEENERMPLLGRSLVHDEGISLLQEWIESLEPNCQ